MARAVYVPRVVTQKYLTARDRRPKFVFDMRELLLLPRGFCAGVPRMDRWCGCHPCAPMRHPASPPHYPRFHISHFKFQLPPVRRSSQSARYLPLQPHPQLRPSAPYPVCTVFKRDTPSEDKELRPCSPSGGLTDLFFLSSYRK